MELARCYELTGRPSKADSAHKRALELNPRSGEFHWRTANFYLRTGATEQAMTHFSSALSLDRSFREQSLGVLQVAGIRLERIKAIWPADRPSRLMLLRFALAQGEQGESFASRYWRELLESGDPPTIDQGACYIQYLLGRDLPAARHEWVNLTQLNGIDAQGFAGGANLVWNGDFENPISRGPLDWRLSATDGIKITREAGTGLNQSMGLSLEFSGEKNLDFRGVAQKLLVDPGRTYEFSFAATSRDLTTDEGVFFQLIEGSTNKVLLESERILGSTPWTQHNIPFRVSHDTTSILVQLRRVPSLRIDNLLAGTLWIDDVLIRPV
jgi:tetratricopeptide (TPR) repeat protein